MSALKLIDAPALARPAGHYSHAVQAGSLLFISGLLPTRPDGVILADQPFEQQVLQVLANLDQVLLSSACDRQQLVQLRVYLSQIENWALFDTLYAKWIGLHKPARCVVPVPELHHAVALELEAVACTS